MEARVQLLGPEVLSLLLSSKLFYLGPGLRKPLRGLVLGLQLSCGGRPRADWLEAETSGGHMSSSDSLCNHLTQPPLIIIIFQTQSPPI